MTSDAPTSSSAPPIEHLILDIGGVILPSAMPQVIAQLVELSGCSEQQLWRFFNTRLFQPFWSGSISIDEFWATFTDYAGVPGAHARWQTEMTTTMLRPLGDVAQVRRWAQIVPVGVLSNQRAEWIFPVFDREGITELFDPLLISSATGLVKPDPRAFAQLTHLGSAPDRVLYVDDRSQALRRAEQHGISTLQAHDDRDWIRRIDERLGLVTPDDALQVRSTHPAPISAPGLHDYPTVDG
jgi:putative hydrolase of the HAD superfamily